jgi:hypothetical protein
VTRKKKIAGIVAVAGAAVALGILLIPRAVCACRPDTPFAVFEGTKTEFQASEAEIRDMVLARLPIGSSLADVDHVCRQLASHGSGNGRACSRQGATIHYRFDLFSSALGVHREGIRLEFLLAGDRLADVRAARARWLFGREL